jgi:3-hydroxybutyryl-CoA dehydrogenase
MIIQSMVVCGAGTMGSGIAQVFAQSGYKTLLFDLQPAITEQALKNVKKNLLQAIEKGKLTSDEMEATLARLSITNNIADCKGDFIIEAIVEKLEAKHSLFTQLAALNGETTILASNTSSISITAIAAKIPFPNRVIGVHFFNPAHLMKLVEIIEGIATDENVYLATKELIIAIGKTVVKVKDAPGFIVNRVARHFYVESLKLAEEQIAPIAQIDRLAENAGFKMGPFKLMDLIGNDINFSVTKSLFDAFHYDSKFRPSLIQEKKVLAGHLGKKSGKGFYEYF